AEYASLLSQKAREVGNAGYHQMAERQARRALALAPKNDRATAAFAVALMGEHRFSEALEIARGRTSIWRLGCEADALRELGRDDEAVEVVQALVDRKPASEAFTRVALLREIHGDAAGALDAWNQALDATK